jgi:integrase
VPSVPVREVAQAVRPITVEDACREYVTGMVTGAVRTRRGHRYKPSTTRGVENRLRLYVVPRIGRLPLASLRRGDVRRLVDELAVETSPATAANVRDALRLVLGRQVDLEVISENVAAKVRAATVDHAPARFLEPGEADELQALADRHPHPCLGALVAMALGTGLRLGELQALVWGREGLDLERRRVVVRATRDRTGELVETKSRRPREVPLGAGLVARLRLYRMTCPRSADGERVFWRSHRRAWEQIREAAGIPELRSHDLRHSAATFWLAAGLTVHAVAELLGHTDAALVLGLYGHALPREVASAGERLETWRAAQRASSS